MNCLASVLADGGSGGSGGGAGPANPFGGFMFPMIAVLLIFMVFQFTSKKKQDKAREAQLNAMKRGDRVRTIGGILGTIVEVRDSEVVVKVDESNNTKIKFDRTAISRIVTEDEKADVKAS
jgi:preprotein translocase subunit YajC